MTVLRCAPGRRATKLITGCPDGSASVDGYDTGKHFSVAEHPVASIHELAAVLTRLSQDGSRFVIRGEPLPGVARTDCRRLLYRHEDGRHVDPACLARGQDGDGLGRAGRDPEDPGEVVPPTARDDAERRRRAGEGAADRADHPVAV